MSTSIMKMFILIICLVSLALAEPPVGDGYPLARSSHDDFHHDHDHHGSDHQRSLSQEYGTPDVSARNAPSSGYDYTAPNARSSLNGRSQSQFPPATVRVSFNQRFSSTAARNTDHSGLDARSQDYSSPNVRSGLSQEYGTPSSKSLSQEYGLPSIAAARSLSTEYGTPNARSSPSEEYGAPAVIAARSSNLNSGSSFRSAQNQGTKHGFASRSQIQDSHGFSSPSSRSNNGFEAPRPFSKSAFSSRSAPSSTYGTPSSRSLSSSYGAPSSRSSDSDEFSQRGPSENYGVPNARSLPQEYGTPSSRSNLNTNAITSSYAARSAPSSTYLPASRSAVPSEQYGTPEQRDGAGQGYDYANKARALEELLSQEPANYDFAYQIEDLESGSDFGHAETRQADRAEGSYFVVLPDGTKQTVEYEADEGGFKPRISVEPADAAARSGGYDDNAQDLARSANGPY